MIIKYPYLHAMVSLVGIFFMMACSNQSGKLEGAHVMQLAGTIHSENLPDTTISNEYEQLKKRITFKHTSEIISDSCYAVWVNKKDNTFSLALHFQYKDTVAVSYSPECWLMFPYKMEKNKIVVYWDNTIDTKYNFDLVKAINKTSKKYIGKPFMTLELVNDTTCQATYLLQELIQNINKSSKKRTFFPDTFVVVQDGEMYD